MRPSGPTPDGNSLDTNTGAISGLFVMPDESFTEVASGLLIRAEKLAPQRRRNANRRRGAVSHRPILLGFLWRSRVGGHRRLGRRPPGTLSATPAIEKRADGLSGSGAYRVFAAPSIAFKCKIKRKYIVQATNDLPASNWWEACVFGQIDRAQYSLRAADGSQPRASATFWDMQHLGERLGKRMVGLLETQLDPAYFLDGMAVFLIGDALRQFQLLGITHVDIISPVNDADWSKILATLCFQEIDQTVVLEKP